MGIGVYAADPAVNFHRVSNPKSPAQEPGAENTPIPSLVEGLKDAQEWRTRRRPEIEKAWLQILGKVEPAKADRRWFTDVRKARILETTETPKYTRIHLELPLESDYWSPSLLLVPKGQGTGPFPAVIAWASTTPDWKVPEEWWGKWLAERGFVVLTGWSHIRGYRDGTSFRNGVSEKVYERFGRWSGLGRMVWDVRQQAEYLRSRKDVDGSRIGFIGLSLSGKTSLYVAAFAPEIAAIVSIDPHTAINGSTNYFAPWYMDWTRKFDDIQTPEKTVLSLLNTDKSRPGLEHDHHEILALAAPRPLLIIGGAAGKDNGGDSDDRQSWGYINRAREVYKLLGVEDRLRFALTDDGHNANGPHIDPEWQNWFVRWLGKKGQ